MTTLPRPHAIATCEWEGFISCRCGWHHRTPHPEQYGPAAMKDYLLDKYNQHRADNEAPLHESQT